MEFSLTKAQARVLKEIVEDMSKPLAMNRLVQGDVGSGKTVIALIAIYISYLNKKQSVFMAPTEILANQHTETIKELLFGLNIHVELLTGSVKGKKREKLLSDLITGNINILIGTHAVIEDNVAFSK